MRPTHTRAALSIPLQRALHEKPHNTHTHTLTHPTRAHIHTADRFLGAISTCARAPVRPPRRHHHRQRTHVYYDNAAGTELTSIESPA